MASLFFSNLFVNGKRVIFTKFVENFVELLELYLGVANQIK